MALPYDVVVAIQDGNGAVAHTKVHLPETLAIADVQIFNEDLCTVIDAIIDGKVIGADLVVPLDLSGSTIKTDPGAQSDNEKGAMFTFRDADGRTFRMRLPAFSDTFVLANSKDVDQAASEVVAFMTDITTGVLTNAPVSRAGVDITSVATAKQSFTKNRKGRRKA